MIFILIFDDSRVSKVMKQVQRRLLDHPFFNSLRCFTACSVLGVGKLIFLVVVIDYDVATVLPCVKRACTLYSCTQSVFLTVRRVGPPGAQFSIHRVNFSI